jgi:hypothetical protein
MKKFFVILLMLAYGFSAAGMTLHLHYCCGKLKNIEWSPTSHECGEKHNMGSKSCCETKLLSGSKTTDHESSWVLTPKLDFVKEPVSVHSDSQPIDIFSTSTNKQRLSHPPPQGPPLLFIQFCVFRI